MTEVTLNLPAELYSELCGKIESAELPFDRIIAALIHRFRVPRHNPVSAGTRIRYQQDHPGGWEVVHVRLDDALYEKCLDMRRLLKCSVSRLVVEELLRSFDEVLQSLLEGGEDSSCVHKFKIYWKITEKTWSYVVCHDQPAQNSG